MFNSNNSLDFFIGKSISRTSSVQITDISAASYIATGEMVVLDSTHNVMTPGSTIADTSSIYIAQGRGTSNPIKISARIDGNSVVGYNGKSYSAAAQQVDFIGYIGSGTNDIDVLTSNDYILRINYKHDKATWSEQLHKRNYYYTSGASIVSSASVAAALAKAVGTDTANVCKVEVLSSHAANALGAGTLSVTNASKIVTASSASHGLVAGDFVRIGSVATTTDPVYKIASVSGVTITLEYNFQGTTASGVTGGIITAAEAATLGVLFGIKLTGLALDFRVGYFPYTIVSYEVTLTEFGDTTVTASTRPTKGTGDGKAIAELEWYAIGFDGVTNRAYHPVPTRLDSMDAVTTSGYDVISIKSYDASENHVISGSKPAMKETQIAIVAGAAQTVNFLAQLNPWMASTSGSFASVTV